MIGKTLSAIFQRNITAFFIKNIIFLFSAINPVPVVMAYLLAIQGQCRAFSTSNNGTRLTMFLYNTLDTGGK
jgi:hypothetical protein